jgi:hypothetical protein
VGSGDQWLSASGVQTLFLDPVDNDLEIAQRSPQNIR